MTTATAMPELSSPFTVPGERIDELREKGHTVIHGLASRDEVEAYRPALHDATMALASDTRPLEERDTYGKAFLQAANLGLSDDRCRGFTFSRRFAGVAAQLLGVDRVRLYHDQGLFKEPGGGRTPWHQDQYYWPLDDERTITMWMPLADVPAEVGTMSFVSGSHRRGPLGEYSISDDSEAAFADMIEREGLPIETHGPLQAGDATFHLGWTLHSAPANPTDEMRPVMTIIYMADGIEVAEPRSDAQRLDLRLWLKGCEPGQPAAGRYNPIVYDAAAG
jgi:hypothetical protein